MFQLNYKHIIGKTNKLAFQNTIKSITIENRREIKVITLKKSSTKQHKT